MLTKKLTPILLVLLAVLLAPQTYAKAEPEAQQWNLPINLNSSNTKISFEVDSTWHVAQFNVKEIKGKAWLEDPNDFKSVRAEVRLAVKDFDSDNSSRDSKMRTVMAEEQFPEVIFNLKGLSKLCNPLQMTAENDCEVIAEGEMQIRDIKQNFSFPAKISKVKNSQQINKFEFKGQSTLDWSTYGVEDPSILIAKVEKQIAISIYLAF